MEISKVDFTYKNKTLPKEKGRRLLPLFVVILKLLNEFNNNLLGIVAETDTSF